jgi:hypothetical protein
MSKATHIVVLGHIYARGTFFVSVRMHNVVRLGGGGGLTDEAILIHANVKS